jgi:hypothetical protein
VLDPASESSVPAIRPSDFAACAVQVTALSAQAGSLDHCLARLAAERRWPGDYARAVGLRYLALGRYLDSPARSAVIPDVLLVLAASATPVGPDGTFDPDLLAAVADGCGGRLQAANPTAA